MRFLIQLKFQLSIWSKVFSKLSLSMSEVSLNYFADISFDAAQQQQQQPQQQQFTV